MSENRRRQKQIIIRLDDDEYNRIKQKADLAEKSVPGFLRDQALKTKIKWPLIPRAEAIEIIKQIKAIGNNLNQLTRKVNQGKAQVAELSETRKELNNLWQLLNSALQK